VKNIVCCGYTFGKALQPEVYIYHPKNSEFRKQLEPVLRQVDWTVGDTVSNALEESS
jgi:hypothetical protein